MGADYYKKGSWNVICDRCGRKFKVEKCEYEHDVSGNKTWFVCNDCWDPVHPQEYVRGVPDRMVVPISRPVPEPIIVTDEIKPEDL